MGAWVGFKKVYNHTFLPPIESDIQPKLASVDNNPAIVDNKPANKAGNRALTIAHLRAGVLGPRPPAPEATLPSGRPSISDIGSIAVTLLSKTRS
jgi:hypothetical protein